MVAQPQSSPVPTQAGSPLIQQILQPKLYLLHEFSPLQVSWMNVNFLMNLKPNQNDYGTTGRNYHSAPLLVTVVQQVYKINEM